MSMTESNALRRLVRGVPARIAGAGVLTLALAAGFAGGRVAASGPSSSPTPAPAQHVVQAAVQAAPTTNSYSAIVDRVTPAVVTVYVEKRTPARQTSMPDLREFFGDQFGQQFDLPRDGQGSQGGRQGRQFRAPEERESGLGSGVIIRPDGYILTNNHVVDSVDKIRVELSDGRSFPATVVGTDELSDLAVIRIQASGLPTLAYGDSDHVKVGDVVLAVGNPLGIGQTVTMGIVSAKGRSPEHGAGNGSYEDFLQTDAPINRGNSGGALVDMKGELVGINAQILSPSGGNIGLGFAIPSGMAQTVADQLINGGVVHRSKLGVGIQSLNPELADSLGLKDMHGALVSSVEAGSPADRAGVKTQDVIVGYNGHAITDANALRNMVASTKPGGAAEIKVLRDGRTETLTAHVVEREADKEATNRNRRGGEDGEEGYGMSLSPLTPQLAKQLDVPAATSGVVVTDLDPNGVAASAGVHEGDLIKRVNGHDVASPSAVKTALSARTGKPALMLVRREGADIFLALPTSRS
jgi:Do/DeqQ family serine protease